MEHLKNNNNPVLMVEPIDPVLQNISTSINNLSTI